MTPTKSADRQTCTVESPPPEKKACPDNRHEQSDEPTIPAMSQVAKTYFLRPSRCRRRRSQTSVEFVPWNERMIARLISVDTFRKNKQCAFHFLTHAHSDHYGGLSSRWARPVYCTKMTAQVLPHLMSRYLDSGDCDNSIAMRSEDLLPLEFGTTNFDGFDVTVLDANHCPGSAMLLFENTSTSFTDGPYFFTGDFRAEQNLLDKFDTDPQFRRITELEIGHAFIDDTYIDDPQTSFLPRAQVLCDVVTTIKETTSNIIIPLFKLGKESAITEIIRLCNERVVLEPRRYALRKLLYPEDVQSKIVLMNSPPASDCRIFVCSLYSLAQLYMQLSSLSETLILILSKLNVNLNQAIPISNIIRFPYSDHSSFEETKAFLSLLRIRHVHFWSEKQQNTDCPRRQQLREVCSIEKQTNMELRIERVAKKLRKELINMPYDEISQLLLAEKDLNDFCPPLVLSTKQYRDQAFDIQIL